MGVIYRIEYDEKVVYQDIPALSWDKKIIIKKQIEKNWFPILKFLESRFEIRFLDIALYELEIIELFSELSFHHKLKLL